jgi:hypothetical protein
MGTYRAIGAFVCAILSSVAACGPDNRNTGPDCLSACSALGFAQCNEDGSFDPPVLCRPEEVCDPEHGCVTCVPDELYCGGASANDVYRCNGEGTGGTFVESCPADNVCSGGQCKTPCEAAEDNPSNVGCEFWAADLDNEVSNILGINNDAAAAQFAIVVANNNDYPVMVTVSTNMANIGQPVNEQPVLQVSVPPRSPQRLNLPQREVDGCNGQNAGYTPNCAGSGTFVSPHAYHIVTTGPVVVYQFNPIVQQYSNDASTLIPRQALGKDYIVVGYETANPCSIALGPAPGIEGVPDHGNVTIIPIADNTTVTVNLSHAVKASMAGSGIPIPMTEKGQTLTLNLSRFMTANLASDQPENVGIFECAPAVMGGRDGDFTGTYIKADKPVVVFTSNERGAGFGGTWERVEKPPGWDDSEPDGTDDTCCTDHLEEQLFPVTALGKEFAVARSPLRSTHATWREPDIIRVVGTVDGTLVTTTLPAPDNQFMLNARQDRSFPSTIGFALSASAPVQVASYLVSQHFVKYGYIGDPSQVLIPAAEQHRKEYVFLVPDTFQSNYAVFSRPVGSTVSMDGNSLDSAEFSNCVKAPIGIVAGTMYEQLTCPITAGKHNTSSTIPFGLTVYGYYNVGSYAFVGGSDVKIINPIL